MKLFKRTYLIKSSRYYQKLIFVLVYTSNRYQIYISISVPTKTITYGLISFSKSNHSKLKVDIIKKQKK